MARAVLLVLIWLAACSPAPSQKTTADAAVTAGERSVTGASPAFPSRLTISVLYFEDRTRAPDLAWLRKGIADMLITDLSRTGGVQVVQRERLEAVFREQALQAGGRVEERTAVRIGRLTGATIILQGTMALVGGLVRLDAHLLDVERGTVLGAASVEGGAGDVLAMEKQLAVRIVELFPPEAAGRAQPFLGPSPTPSQAAAGALYEGVDAADRGNVPEALARLETALGRDPRFADAQGRYQRMLQAVDTEQLRGRATAADATLADRQRLAARMADDLLRNGLRTVIEGRDFPLIRIEVRFDEQALRDLRGDVARLGGTVEVREGRLLVRASSHPAVHEAFARAAALPRRLYLYLLAPDGRRLAVYSRFRRWQGGDWISQGPDDRIVVQSERRLSEQIALPVAPADRAFAPARIRAGLDVVPREEGVVRVELLGTGESGRESLLSPHPQGRKVRSGAGADMVRAALQEEIERSWNPPIWERLPGPGYLPSARRATVVTAAIQADGPGSPTVADGSGEPDYDAACAGAWLGMDRTRLAEPLSKLRAEEDAPVSLRVRIHCALLKDIPPP